MNLAEARSLSAEELVAALDDLGIGPGWHYGDLIREASLLEPTKTCLGEPPGRRVEAFQNLVVGTIAERTFREGHLAPLEPAGFKIVDYHEAGENRDFGVQRDGLELPINVKVASTMFREAKRVVNLDPDDCIPIPAYKTIGAIRRTPDLVYVDLVDFKMRERVDRFMDGLAGALAIGWHVLSWYAGRGARKAQDRYNATLFERHAADLMALAPGSTSFRVVSAQRVLAVMRKVPTRVPGLGVKAAGWGVFQAEVNVHLSVRDETLPWDEVAEQLRRDGITPVLELIRRTAVATIPDPAL